MVRRYSGFIATLFVLCSLAVASAVPAGSLAAAEGTLDGGDLSRYEEGPIQPRVMWLGNPQQEAVIAWTTKSEGSKHVVHYGTKSISVKAGYESEDEADTNGQYQGDGPRMYFHHAHLKSLKPGTVYYFTMESDGVVSDEYHFITAFDKDVPFKMIYGGDSRSRLEARRKMNRLIAKHVEEDETIMAFGHGGDFIADGDVLVQWYTWLDDHQLTITGSDRILPIMPTRGNHDKGHAYSQVFASTGAYANMLSPQVLFTTDFSEATFQKHADSRWKVAMYHVPMYPAVKGKPIPARIALFEKYNLTVACEAHGHCIKRTVPIRGGKQDPTGVVYIGEGALAAVRQPNKRFTEQWYLQPPAKTGTGNHFQLLAFGKDSLAVEVKLMDGSTFDTHTIPAR